MMTLLKLLCQWLNFRAEIAILRLKFFKRVFVLRLENHYLRVVFYFLSRRSRRYTVKL